MANDTPNARAAQLEELAEKQAGISAVQNIVDKHLGRVMQIREHFPLENIDLLSTTVNRKRGVIGAVADDIAELHGKIRMVIAEVAKAIEDGNYKASEQAIGKLPLGYNDRAKANALIAADKQLLVSFQSLNIAVEIFVDLNKTIVKKLSDVGGPAAPELERNLLLANAILVYELTDFVIGYVEHFELEGVKEIERLRSETKKRLGELRKEHEKVKRDALAKEVEPGVREGTLEDVKAGEETIRLIEQEWDKLVERNGKIKEGVEEVSTNLPTLRLVRDNAKRQINLLEAITVLQIVKRNLANIQTALQALKRLELVSLSPDRVRRLLGIDSQLAARP
jgi:hypothetical protein